MGVDDRVIEACIKLVYLQLARYGTNFYIEIYASCVDEFKNVD